MGPPYLPGPPPSALWESPVSFLPSPGRPFPVPSLPFPGQAFPVPLLLFAERSFPALSPFFAERPFPEWPFPAPLPFFPVRRLRALSAPSPERGSRPPRAAPDLCPDRLRQSGFSIFHRPFAIPPSWFSGIKKCLRHINSPSPSFMRGIRGFFFCSFPA